MTHEIKFAKAKRAAVPLLIGLTGPSGGGKTFSALRLATGIRRVTGGKIYCIDTEARRALHYADDFDYEHGELEPPFGPLRYLDAIVGAVEEGARIVIVDSMSHEHEGPGGVLEMHDKELDRLAGQDWDKRKRMSMLAWQKPKAERRRMINTILQLPISMIFCFRAKEKLKLVPGKEPVHLGYMPIAGEEFTFEMTVNCLLMPRADGVPLWRSEEIGERATMKLPTQFRTLLEQGGPLSEDHGEAMARWAAGGKAVVDPVADAFAARIAAAQTLGDLKPVVDEIVASKARLSPAELRSLDLATRERKVALKGAVVAPAAAPAPTPAPEPSQSEERKPVAGVDEPPESWTPSE